MKMPVSPGVLPKSADVLAALKNTDLLDMNLRITCEPSPVDECVAVDEMSRAEAEITSELERRGVIAELASSNRVTRWAYSQTEGAGGLTWVRADEMVPLAATWRDLIQPLSEM